ncbi:MAG TPA: ADP-ribosylglycohydrolase family protein, partial [Plesiomonas shigelloides]|nr:ADP-ribosylglycohydrolase family protein [Plesiomonas shigelloides]
ATAEEGLRTGLDEVYDLIGSGMDVIESVPAAIAIVELAAGEPMRCAELCANLGGDTDTIGAMATAICGALNGVDAFPLAARTLIAEANQIDLAAYAQQLTQYRQTEFHQQEV